MNLERYFSLKDHVIIITGGYGFLGKGMVEALIDAGAVVIVAARSKEKFFLAFPEPPGSLFFIEADILQGSSIKDLFSNVWTRFNRIDAIINNAFTLVTDGVPENISDAAFSESLQGTLGSAYTTIREVIPFFQQQGRGRIINISSMYGLVSPDFSIYESAPHFINPPHYGAAKAGILQLTRYFASYLAKDQVLVNCITPGPFPGPEATKNKEFISALEKRTVLHRVGSPDDLQGAIIFLCSPSSGFITGQNFIIDGGWTIR